MPSSRRKETPGELTFECRHLNNMSTVGLHFQYKNEWQN